METIKLKEFIRDFMEISENLTKAEIRILYLLINEPEVKSLSQLDFASKILADRRTINLGLKKLKEFGYIKAPNSTQIDVINNLNYVQKNNLNIPTKEIRRNQQFILEAFIDFYHPSKNTFIVNEDFYSSILRDRRLHKKCKNNKEFITETIRKSYPSVVFYFDKGEIFTKEQQIIIRRINAEIIKTRSSKSYYFKKDNLMEHLNQIREEEVLQVIQNVFPKLTIDGNRIKIPKPLISTW